MVCIQKIMRRGGSLLLGGMLLLGMTVSGAKAEEAKDQLQVLQALNQIAVSLNHIITYNDRVVLDQEYNAIINNLNLSKIPDGDIITLLQELMDLLVSSKIQDVEREYLEKNYDMNVQNELKERIRTRILESDPATLPYTIISSAVLSTGSFYFNYRAQMDTYKKEKTEGEWKIKQQTLQGLNNFYKKLLKHSWELMRKYNFPDEWRLDEKQLTDYTALLKEPDLELRYRKLERIETAFQKFPPYWYYRGSAAQEIGNKEEALHCFEQFQAIHQGILRKDPYAAAVAMRKIMLLADEAAPDQQESDLKLILANSEDTDWGNILFAALEYAKLGDTDKAGKLILRNLDNGHTAFIDSPGLIRTVGPALLSNARADVFSRVMKLVLSNDQVKNYDVLWLYGAIRNQDILKRIETEFDHILLLSSDKSGMNPLNIFKGDSLSLFIPTRWTAENVTVALSFTDDKGTREFRPAEVSLLPDYPAMTVMTFKDVFSIKSFLKKKRSAEIRLSMVREPLPEDKSEAGGYQVELFFRSEIIPSADHLRKVRQFSNFLLNSATEAPSESEADGEKEDEDVAVWFAKDKIRLNGETFGWSDAGIIFP